MSTAKRVIENTEELAVSTDFNLMQQFAAQERNDMLAALLTPSKDALFGIGQSTTYSGANTPLPGYVLRGFGVVVDNPGSVLVNPGVLLAYPADPGDANDSGWVLVEDPGIPSVNVLVIAANASVSVRVDVIEVQVYDKTTLQSTRNIWNPAIPGPVPTLVDKIHQPALNYRVRQGTPGSAPGYAAGWMPIAVAVLQPGTALNQVDFYDCRPLWRETQPTADIRTVSTTAGAVDNPTYAPSEPVDANWRIAGNQATPVASGLASTKAFGVTFGGAFFKNVPCSAAEFNAVSTLNLDAQDAWKGASAALPGGTAVQDDIIGLFAVLPDLGGGIALPRFVRYTQGAAPRVPQGGNGLYLWANFKDFPSPTTDILLDKVKGGTINATRCPAVLGNGIGVLLAWTMVNTALTPPSVDYAARASIHEVSTMPSPANPDAGTSYGFRTPNSAAGLAIDAGNSRFYCTCCPADSVNVYTSVFRRLRVACEINLAASSCVYAELHAYLVLDGLATSFRIPLASRIVPVSGSTGSSFGWEFDIPFLAWATIGGMVGANLYIDVTVPTAGTGSTPPTLGTSYLRFVGAATN